MGWPRRHKFGAVRTETGGVSYASKHEAKVAQDLQFTLQANQIKEFARQIPITLEAYGVKICTYLIDFKVIHNNGTVEYIEAKGYETPEWKLKWKMFVAKMAVEQPDAILTIRK